MAMDRAAKGEALAPRVERVKYGVYRVPSQTEEGVWWMVVDLTALGTGHGLRCTCPAGMVGKPCAHVEAVVIRRQREQPGRVSAMADTTPRATATFRFAGIEYGGAGANVTEALAGAIPR